MAINVSIAQNIRGCSSTSFSYEKKKEGVQCTQGQSHFLSLHGHLAQETGSSYAYDKDYVTREKEAWMVYNVLICTVVLNKKQSFQTNVTRDPAFLELQPVLIHD